MSQQPEHRADTTESHDLDLSQIEKRDSQLWWLAISIIVLLTIAVTAVDTYPMFSGQEGWRSGLGLDNVNNVTIRLSLIVASFLICTYFRECARALLRMNRALVNDLKAGRTAMERKTVELSRMKQLSDVLMSRQDLSSALDIALQMATEVIGADTASVMLMDESRETLRIVAARGISEEIIKETRIKVGEGFAGIVASEGEPIILDSDDMDDRLRALAHRSKTVRSAIICPIKVDGLVRGVINVTNRQDGGKYTKDNLNTVATLAQQASMVIQKIELYEHLELQVVKLQEALDELSRTQNELVQAEKLGCIGQLAGGIAHEINNPLHVMLGRAELMLMNMSDDAPGRRDVQILYDQSERLAKIVQNLLRFARKGDTLSHRRVSIDQVLRDTLELIESQMTTYNIDVVHNHCEGPCDIWGNSGELQQVFLNIILNAYHAMKPSGGRIEISTQIVAQNVEVLFSDTGPGIEPEHLSHLFEPFFTTKAEGEGAGLGLSVSYGIVQAHGGRLEVESNVGAGATFKVVLPPTQVEIAA